MQRYVFFVYGIVCHLLFLATFSYMAGFVGGFPGFKSIDTTGQGTVQSALAINLGLLALFAVQHSVMARPTFKRVWTRIVPRPIERSTYVLASSVVLIVLMWQWRGIDTVVWDIQHPAARAAAWGLFVTGWLLVPIVTLLIDHFDLFGTRQVWLHFHRREYQSLAFRVPLFYKHVRHPLYVGWAIAFWAIPTMTLGHLLFAAVLTGYMGLAALLEERNLVDHFGRAYEDYQRRVPMFIPQLKSAGAAASSGSLDAEPLAKPTTPWAAPSDSETCHV